MIWHYLLFIYTKNNFVAKKICQNILIFQVMLKLSLISYFFPNQTRNHSTIWKFAANRDSFQRTFFNFWGKIKTQVIHSVFLWKDTIFLNSFIYSSFFVDHRRNMVCKTIKISFVKIYTAQEMKLVVSILRIWTHIVEKYLMENLISCAVTLPFMSKNT